MREWQASPLGPPVGSGRPCRWALSSSGVLPQGFFQSQGQGDWGVRSPRGTVCQWGQEGQRQRGAPPKYAHGEGTGLRLQGKAGGPRGPALSPPSLASPSDVGRTGHGSFSCGCHTRSLRPPTSGSLDGGGTSPFASSSLPPGAVSGRSQELQLTSRQRECARGQRECARGRGRVLVAGVPRGRLWLTRRCGSRRDQRSLWGLPCTWEVAAGGGPGDEAVFPSTSPLQRMAQTVPASAVAGPRPPCLLDTPLRVFLT